MAKEIHSRVYSCCFKYFWRSWYYKKN